MSEVALDVGPEDFPPARRALHQRIVNQLLAGYTPSPEGEREALLTAGGVASGKTTLVRALRVENPNIVHISGDRIKTMLPEFAALKTLGRLGSDNPLNKEAGLIAQLALDEAQRRGLDIAYESTFSGPVARREAQLRTLLENGYLVTLRGRELAEDKAIARARRRAAESELPEDFGRNESEEAIRRSNREAARNVMRLGHLAHEVSVWDTSGREPIPIFRQFAGQAPEVYDQDRYEAYRRKAATADAPGETGGPSGEAGAGDRG